MSIATQQSLPNILTDAFCADGGFVQQTADPVTLIKHAEQTRTQILKYARALAGALDLEFDQAVKMGPIKTLERIWQKAIGKYDGRVEKICDIARERLYINSPADIIDLRSLFGPGKAGGFHETWSSRGVHVLEFEDYFAKPSSTGFRGINIKLGVDMGKGRFHICELQVLHGEMKDTLDTTHMYFEQIREYKDNAEAQKRELSPVEMDVINRLEAEATRLHNEEAERLGLNMLEQPQVQRHTNNQLALSYAA